MEMLKSIIFYLALWLSFSAIIEICNIIMNKEKAKVVIHGYVAVILWSILYCLS